MPEIPIQTTRFAARIPRSWKLGKFGIYENSENPRETVWGRAGVKGVLRGRALGPADRDAAAIIPPKQARFAAYRNSRNPTPQRPKSSIRRPVSGRNLRNRETFGNVAKMASVCARRASSDSSATCAKKTTTTSRLDASVS